MQTVVAEKLRMNICSRFAKFDPLFWKEINCKMGLANKAQMIWANLLLFDKSIWLAKLVKNFFFLNKFTKLAVAKLAVAKLAAAKLAVVICCCAVRICFSEIGN